jgi:hypothetical protein
MAAEKAVAFILFTIFISVVLQKVVINKCKDTANK